MATDSEEMLWTEDGASSDVLRISLVEPHITFTGYFKALDSAPAVMRLPAPLDRTATGPTPTMFLGKLSSNASPDTSRGRGGGCPDGDGGMFGRAIKYFRINLWQSLGCRSERL